MSWKKARAACDQAVFALLKMIRYIWNTLFLRRLTLMGSPQRKRQFKGKARRATLIIADITYVFLYWV